MGSGTDRSYLSLPLINEMGFYEDSTSGCGCVPDCSRCTRGQPGALGERRAGTAKAC